jgi:hypothetical protein
MVALFLESPREVRRGRLPYLAVSFVLMCLWSASSILLAWSIYNMLLHARPGEEEFRVGLAYAGKIQDTTISMSSLLWDVAVRVADAVLVCPIVYQRLRAALNPFRCIVASSSGTSMCG